LPGPRSCGWLEEGGAGIFCCCAGAGCNGAGGSGVGAAGGSGGGGGGGSGATAAAEAGVTVAGEADCNCCVDASALGFVVIASSGTDEAVGGIEIDSGKAGAAFIAVTVEISDC